MVPYPSLSVAVPHPRVEVPWHWEEVRNPDFALGVLTSEAVPWWGEGPWLFGEEPWLFGEEPWLFGEDPMTGALRSPAVEGAAAERGRRRSPAAEGGAV